MGPREAAGIHQSMAIRYAANASALLAVIGRQTLIQLTSSMTRVKVNQTYRLTPY